MLFYKQTKDCKGKEEEYAHADEYNKYLPGTPLPKQSGKNCTKRAGLFKPTRQLASDIIALIEERNDG